MGATERCAGEARALPWTAIPLAMTPTRTALGALVATLAPACASPAPEPALQPPSLIRASAVAPAAGLDRPRFVAAPEGGSEAAPPGFLISARALWLIEPFDVSALAPLAAEVDVVADLRGEPVTLATPELTASALVARGAAAREWAARLHADGPRRAHLMDRTEALPASQGGPAHTWEVALTSLERETDPRDWLDEFPDRGPFRRSAALRITPEGPGLRLTMEIDDLDPDVERALREEILDEPNKRATPPPPLHTESLRAEAVTLAVEPEEDGSVTIALQLDAPFQRSGDGSLVFIVSAKPITALELLSRSGDLVLATGAGAAADEPTPDSLIRAEALEVFRSRGGRAALLALAREGDALLAIDLSLVATSEDLALLAAEAFPATPGARAPQPMGATTTDDAIAWRLESTSWRFLARGALTESLPPELQGVFFVHAGALARFPDVVIDALARSGQSMERFRERLVAEHLLALEDPSPATRVRAHDWLDARGRSVEGFDPLAPRTRRHAALEAAAAEPENTAVPDGDDPR